MAWRLYDLINYRWYNDELYATREACITAATIYMGEAKSLGGALELLVEALAPSEWPAVALAGDEDTPG